MNYKKVKEINEKRVVLTNEMLNLALKVSPAMDLDEMSVIQTEIDVIRDQLNALPTLEDAAYRTIMHHYLCTVTFEGGTRRTFDLKVADPTDEKVRLEAIERAVSNSKISGEPQAEEDVVFVEYKETGYLIY
ncbi:hypothetical protein BS614_30970 (plasmid) [Paenibacillus xylanexedens]|uniref:hypothetical protein n=1 Tax=Paenibacillus xylanexedens TaxID=528191 RepID=UPI000938091C|nr:hypothetical protein [Paenibacillus xylanexedens]APO48542.1 hypothetical protein BS614_30970 [Paenibacillus xylanexedens]